MATAISTSTALGDTSATTRVGTLDYIEGSAFVNGKQVKGNRDNLPILDDGGTLRTEKGHAEMLLTPGVFLRLDSSSEVRLQNASLIDTRLRLDQGAAMLEVDDLYKDNRILVGLGSGTVRVLKPGLYRFEAQPAKVEVLKGKVESVESDRTLTAGKHREILLSSGLTVAKFKAVPDDDLSRWSRLRSEYEAEASVASAQYIYDMGWPWGFSSWFWNPWFDTWTWLPARGFWLNPYGFGYWSPFMVYRYYPARYYGVRHYAYAPGAGSVSPSGLNLQRGPALQAARSGVVPGFRSAGTRMATGRPMGTPAMGGRSFPMGGRAMGGGFAHGRR